MTSNPHEKWDWTTHEPYASEPGAWEMRVVDDQSIGDEIAALRSDDDSDNTRSPWFWVSTPDGDIMLACYPRGDAFMGAENDWGRGPLKTSNCRHCGREIILVDQVWVDPEATGDDEIWRETCEGHDTFTAEHEPEEAP